MNTKFNSCEASMIHLTNGVTLNLKSLQGLKNVLLTTKRPKKYIITLKPIIPRRKDPESQTQTEHPEVTTNIEDEFEANCKFDPKFIVRPPKLEKIDEKSEKSTSSIESENYDLKPSQLKTTDLRLSGGWGLNNLIKKKNNSDEGKSSGNKKTEDEAKEVVAVRNAQEEYHKQSSAKTSKQNEYKNSEERDKEKKGEILADNTSNKSGASQYEDCSSVINKDDVLQPTIVIEETVDLNNKFPAKDFKIANEQQTATTIGPEPIHSNPDELIASSFISSLLKETVPRASSKCGINDLISACGESVSLHTQCELQDIQPKDAKLVSDLFCLLPSDNEICTRIEHLEKQMDQLYTELKEVYKKLLPSNDLAKLNVLSKNFDEVSDLLGQLKFSCLKLQNMESPIIQTNLNESSICEGKETISQENLHSITDFSASHVYFGTCNCEIYDTELPLCAERESCRRDCKSSQTSNPVYNNSQIPRPLVHDFQRNIKHFQNPQSHVKRSCTKHHQKSQQQNSIEQSRHQTQQDVLLTTVTENNSPQASLAITSRLQPAEKETPTIKLPQRWDDNKYGSTDLNISLGTSKPDRSPDILFSYSTPSQRLFAKPRRIFSTSSSKRDLKYPYKDTNNNYKKSMYKKISPKQYNDKTRHSAGRDALIDQSSSVDNETKTKTVQDTISNSYGELPLTTHNISQAVWEIVGNRSSNKVALTIFLESNNLYHINVSDIETGQCLGCIYTNEAAFKQAKKKKLFDTFLVFFVLNSDNNLEERRKVLDYSFELINTRD